MNQSVRSLSDAFAAFLSVGTKERADRICEVIDQLTKVGEDINKPNVTFNKRRSTPLCWAVSYENEYSLRIIEKLLDAGASVNAPNDVGDRPLNWVSTESMFDKLLKAGACIKVAGGNKIFRLAIAIGSVKMLDKVVEVGGGESVAWINELNGRDNKTALHEAIEKKSAELIIKLLQAGASINILDGRRYTQLHLAVKMGNVNIIKMLLARITEETSVLTSDNVLNSTLFHTAIETAIEKDSLEIIQMLLHVGAKAVSINYLGDTPLYFAVERGRVDIVNMLLKDYPCCGARESINMPNACGNTPIFIAIDKDNVEMVQLLLDNGASVDVLNNNEYTPLYTAIVRDNQQIIESVLSGTRTIDIGSKNPLTAAARKGNMHVIEKLLYLGASVNRPNLDDSYLPLHAAIENGSIDVIEKLLENNAQESVNESNQRGVTPLHAAIQLGSIQIIDKLLAIGASVNACDVDGNTPVHAAVQKGSADIIDRLLNTKTVKCMNETNKYGQTPFDIIFQFEEDHANIQFALIVVFLNHGAEVPSNKVSPRLKFEINCHWRKGVALLRAALAQVLKTQTHATQHLEQENDEIGAVEMGVGRVRSDEVSKTGNEHHSNAGSIQADEEEEDYMYEIDEEFDEVEGENDVESVCMQLSSEMGFDIDVVRAALELHKGDVNAALVYLSSPSDALEGVSGTVLPSRVTRILSNSNLLRSISRSNSSNELANLVRSKSTSNSTAELSSLITRKPSITNLRMKGVGSCDIRSNIVPNDLNDEGNTTPRKGMALVSVYHVFNSRRFCKHIANFLGI